MITAPYYQDKHIGVFGLARTGVAAVHALVASGAKVMAWDDNQQSCKQAGEFAGNLYDADFSEFDALLLAPGVPLTFPTPHKLVEKAAANDVPLLSDVDVFQTARDNLAPHKVVAITGTNGKSTTTALIHHIVATLGMPAEMGGNIGTGILSLDPLPKKGVYVFELSSFQLELTQSFDADIAILLNVSPDHLDRHGDMKSYVAAKARLFEMQSSNRTAVISVDDEYGLAMAAACNSNIVPISVQQTVEGGIYIDDGMLVDDIKGKGRIVGDVADLVALKGVHNWQNAAAAYAACRKLGLKSKSVYEAMKTFPGLVHRQELVPTKCDFSVVNDSKATNVDAALRALRTFPRIRWIAGGRSKDRDFQALANGISAVRKAYLMGEHGPDIGEALPDNLLQQKFKTMQEAVTCAIDDAEEGDTVLLSPACTAFDQFANFEERGDAFKAQVAATEKCQ
ncbi:UDP-N-acetylmuramoyl-L-alanine--D-glutamate ligase [Kordiimonas aquimaris]|uniref:UDP-N-acetylmuramoyl-L-alanine--D-glutamate ligase n=1 Tax=Kordiimonas aquimaris TaxID=707591 RepID=UPI0021D1D375|nr:UDP-N-acetylmuramoyl-L-alanine--D-glutamate ligase [Kordiimonas aquimaris]